MRLSPLSSCVVCAALPLLVACGGAGTSPEAPSNDFDAGIPAVDAGVNSVQDASNVDSSPPDAGSRLDSAAPMRPLRFVAIGDTGTGSADQKRVADAMKTKCDASGCDFVVMLGDNFYDSGVTSVTDSQWTTKFEQPYAALNLPFWAVLGNHDYGANGAGTDFTRPDPQVAYARTSTKWHMPSRHWHHVAGEVEFFGLDTNEQMFDRAATQKSNMNQWIASSRSKWKIALGHHPYLSNGPHGNAGSYDKIPFVPIANGANVKKFMDDVVCGKVDVYFSGHDHNRQYMQGKCGGTTELIVSGAGAKVTALEGSNAVHFQAATLGFVYVTVDDTTFTAEFIDANGRSEFVRTLRK